MIKRILASIVGIGIVVIAIAAIVVWEPSLPETKTPAPDSFSQQQIDKGRVLAGIGNCAACHTENPDKPYAGGRPIPTPFGTIYTANITPDPTNGIGRWSEEAFARAMKEGVSRSGAHLFPAFPYTHFSKVRDEDIKALYAYLMTQKPVASQPPDNTLKFPYNIRMLQAGWKLLFFDDEPWQPVADKSAQWNRGAYLAEGLGHCSSCHTPRNDFGAEREDARYAGAMVDNWYAPALNASHRAPAPWTGEEAYNYLRAGGSALHGVAVGSMAEVVHQGLARASDDDIHALATYFSDLSGAADESQAQAMTAAAKTIEAAHRNAAATLSRGEALYAKACAACHYNSADQPKALRPEMSLNSAVNAPNPDNLIRATLHGVSIEDGLPGVMMPGFASALSDEDLVSLVTFLRETQSSQPAWSNLSERVRSLRQ